MPCATERSSASAVWNAVKQHARDYQHNDVTGENSELSELIEAWNLIPAHAGIGRFVSHGAWQ
jgi:hypothetical protein